MPAQTARPTTAESAAGKPATAAPSKPGPKINPTGGPPRIGSSGSVVKKVVLCVFML